MCTGGAISPPTPDCYVMIPPADPKLSPAAPILPPAPLLSKNVRLARLMPLYFSTLIILLALLILVPATVPEYKPDITVESLSSSSPSSAAMAWDVGFSISDTKTYENLTMKATLFRGNVPVSYSTTLGPVVLGSPTTAATFSVPNTTALHARYLTPCMAVANLTAKLEFEEPVPLVKSSMRLLIVCQNVVVLLSSNSSSCYSSSPPALLDRASCRNDSLDLNDTLIISIVFIMMFLLLMFLGYSLYLEKIAKTKF